MSATAFVFTYNLTAGVRRGIFPNRLREVCGQTGGRDTGGSDFDGQCDKLNKSKGIHLLVDKIRQIGLNVEALKELRKKIIRLQWDGIGVIRRELKENIDIESDDLSQNETTVSNSGGVEGSVS